MSQVAINKCNDREAVSQELQNAGRIAGLIREKAFHLFQNRGGGNASEFSAKHLFRRVNLPGRIDLDHVSASLEKGMLRISAPRALSTAAATSR